MPISTRIPHHGAAPSRAASADAALYSVAKWVERTKDALDRLRTVAAVFWRTTSLTVLASYVLLSLAMLPRNGAYTRAALLLALFGFALAARGVVTARRHTRREQKPCEAWFAAALAGFLTLSACMAPAVYLHQQAFATAYRAWSAAAALAVTLVYVLGSKRWVLARRALFVLGVAAAFAFRAWLPIASPRPVIDVFNVFQESSQHLLDGRNPYTEPISDAYQGKASFGYTIHGYVYLPANLYLLAPAKALFGDIRYGYVLAEAAIVAMLWQFARRRWDESVAELLPLLLLYHPRSLFVIEQAWSEPLILLFFALSLLLYERGRRAGAAAANGVMISLKLYLLFFAFQWLYLERNRWRLLLGLSVAALTVLPFVLVDWHSFFVGGIVFQMRTPFRPDSLTVFGYLSPLLGLRPPKSWSIGVGAVLAVTLAWSLRKTPPLLGYLLATTTTMLAMLIFGSQAFCNYYWFVSGMMLFLLAAAPGGERTMEMGRAPPTILVA